MPKAGGDSTIVAQGQDHPVAIAHDGLRIYWTNAAPALPAGGSVMALEKSP
jgi:hypothetical protein